MKKLNNENYCMITLVNDNFLVGGEILLYSFLKHNSWFNGDIIIIHSDKLCYLSEKSKNIFMKIYPKIKFHKVDENDYKTIDLSKAKVKRFAVSYLTLESFRFDNYDRVVFLDSDIVILGDIKKLFENDNYFGAIYDSRKYPMQEKQTSGLEKNDRFNGGVLSISKKFLGEKIFKDMIKIASLGDWNMADQATMNKFFEGIPIKLFSNKYNALKRCFPDNINFTEDLKKEDVRVLHYVGKKPWQSDEEKSDLNINEKIYKKINKIWKKYYEDYEREFKF